MKKIAIILLLTACIQNICAKNDIYTELNISQKDICKLNERITELAKKEKIIEYTTDINIFHVYWLSNDSCITDKDLTDGKYKVKVKPLFYTFGKQKKQKYLKTNLSYILSKQENRLLGYGDARVFNNYPNPENIALLKSMQSKNFTIFFSITMREPVFGVTQENETFVIRKKDRNDYETIPLNKYIELYFGEISSPPFGDHFFKKE